MIEVCRCITLKQFVSDHQMIAVRRSNRVHL
ncbi:hypothetical protein CBM2626_B110319 [Cupriavidus taiwanensis]|nr:hypothetical protein CBM2626_B110319 [Cupriavidus taiwanensis]